MPTVCIYRLLKVSGFICENGHLSELVGCAMFQLYDAVHIKGLRLKECRMNRHSKLTIVRNRWWFK